MLPDRGAVDHDRAVHAGLHRAAGARPATGAAPSPWAAWRRSSPAAGPRGQRARPSRRSARTRQREAGDGFDGSWVAHPDLVPVCREVFDAVLGDRPNQLDRQRDDVARHRRAAARRRLAPGRDHRGRPARQRRRGGRATSTAWLGGNGAVGIHNLMEDAATAEISRSQVWQWVHNGVAARHRRDRHRASWSGDVLAEETEQLRGEVGDEPSTTALRAAPAAVRARSRWPTTSPTSSPCRPTSWSAEHEPCAAAEPSSPAVTPDLADADSTTELAAADADRLAERTTRATTARASRCTPSTSRPTASPRSSPPTGARQALAALDEHGGRRTAVRRCIGQDAELAAAVAPRVRAKLGTRADRGPAARLRGRLRRPRRRRGGRRRRRRRARPGRGRRATGPPPPFVGIRFKCFEAPTRRRGPAHPGPVPRPSWPRPAGCPTGFVVTLPKVTSVDQVEAMVDAVSRLEDGPRPARRPAAASRSRSRRRSRSSGPDGTALGRADDRTPPPAGCTGLHYGTYDYSRVLRDRRRVPVAWSTRSPTTPRRSCRSPRPAPASGSPTAPPTSCPVGDGDAVRRGLAAALPAGPPLAGARLLPGLGPAPGPAAHAGTPRPTPSTATGSPCRGRALQAYLGQQDSQFLDEPATAARSRASSCAGSSAARSARPSSPRTSVSNAPDSPSSPAVARPDSLVRPSRQQLV